METNTQTGVLSKIHPDLVQYVIVDFNKLSELVKELRSQNKKIAITQGSYDMFHVGHGRYLMGAKKRADITIIGVDDDEYVKATKGQHRPIWPENERLETLVHMKWVDYVYLQTSKEDAVRMIRELKPDVLIVSESTKGVEHTERVKNAHKEYCGEIVVLPPQATTSTSNMIRNLVMSGVRDFQKHIQNLLNNAKSSFAMTLSGVMKEVDDFADSLSKREDRG